ncbi:hypothetical protein AMTRI_Chr05g69160 [Amborella trichopoda]
MNLDKELCCLFLFSFLLLVNGLIFFNDCIKNLMTFEFTFIVFFYKIFHCGDNCTNFLSYLRFIFTYFSKECIFFLELFLVLILFLENTFFLGIWNIFLA